MEHQILPNVVVESIGCGPVLVFATHPADEAFACGGAIMRHVAAGDSVRVVVLTDGNDGTQAGHSDYSLKRQCECRQAAIILGYGEPVFKDISACRLEYGELLIRYLQDSIEQQMAELVYAPSCWEVHSEYCALAMATAEAVRRCPRRVRLVMYEVGVPLHPNMLLDITDLQERKAAAIACFITQSARQPNGSLVAALNRFRTYTLPITVQAAEAYCLLTGEELRENPLIIKNGAYRLLSDNVKDIYPLVSVIIRSMGRKSLSEALDSVAVQTYPHIEIVVIDAKGREHPDLPGWWGRFPLRLIQLKSPLSRSRAANVGIDHALGEYLIFLDDDDVFYPDHISALVKILCRSDKPRCAYTGVRVEYYNQGQLVRMTTFNEPFHRMKLWGCNFISIHAVLFERSLYDQGCCFDESLNIFEDWDFWVQISLRCDFVHIDQISACYRNYGHSGLGDQVNLQVFAKASADFFNKWKNL